MESARRRGSLTAAVNPAHGKNMKNLSTYLLMLTTVLIWGGTYVAGRSLDPALNSVVSSFVRMVLAFAVLVGLCLVKGVPLLPISKKLFIMQIFMGLTGVFMYSVFFHQGIQTVSGGRAAVIINTNPLMIAVVAALFMDEKLTPFKAGGVLLAALGAVWVVSHGHISELFSGRITLGDGYLFVSAVSWAAFSLLGKVAMRYGIRPLASITWSVFFGMLMMLIVALTTGQLRQVSQYALPDWLSIAYLGICSTVGGFVFYYKIINKVGAMRAGVICCAIPVAAIGMTALFLGENLSWSLATGAAITVVGIFMVNYTAKSKPLK